MHCLKSVNELERRKNDKDTTTKNKGLQGYLVVAGDATAGHYLSQSLTLLTTGIGGE